MCEIQCKVKKNSKRKENEIWRLHNTFIIFVTVVRVLAAVVAAPDLDEHVAEAHGVLVDERRLLVVGLRVRAQREEVALHVRYICVLRGKNIIQPNFLI